MYVANALYVLLLLLEYQRLLYIMALNTKIYGNFSHGIEVQSLQV